MNRRKKTKTLNIRPMWRFGLQDELVFETLDGSHPKYDGEICTVDGLSTHYTDDRGDVIAPGGGLYFVRFPDWTIAHAFEHQLRPLGGEPVRLQ